VVDHAQTIDGIHREAYGGRHSPLAEMVHKVVGVVPKVLYVLLGKAGQVVVEDVTIYMLFRVGERLRPQILSSQ
ncbi:hypothetical protein HAX54_009003, partial [Datura stramonium]|nr:hypothetical protein [Datura stramonium]